MIDQSTHDILDHNDTCSVNAVGYDIGVRKRKSTFMIKWDDQTTLTSPLNDDPATFSLEIRNLGQQLDLSQETIKIDDTVTHNGFEYFPPSLQAGTAWNCGTPTQQPLPLSFNCTYTGVGLTTPGIVPPGFDPSPLQLERGFALPPISFDVRGNETGWWKNCAKVTLSGPHTDEVSADDTWCVNIFVQGNIAVAKTTGRANNEYDYDSITNQSEPIDLTIAVSNYAARSMHH